MSRRLATVVTGAALLGAPLLAVGPAEAADPVTINLIGINDFHGRIDANTVKFAGTVEKIRQEGGSDSSLLISAGDNVSASLFASATQGDIPTIDVLNALGLDASAAGNHEFDKGADDLVGRLSDAADFPFLAANVFRNGAPLLDRSATFDIKGVKVAVVGAVTQETLALVSPGGMQGVTITDPTEAINDTVADLEALPADQKPDVIVASIHEGAPDGTQTYADQVAHSAVFKEIAEETSPDVDAIFMGHTHQAYTYDAPVPGRPGKTRPLIQTGNYGANVGNVKLTVDPDTGDVVSYTQRNVARTTDTDASLVAAYPDVAQVQKITNDALAFADAKGKEVVGQVTADITTAFSGGKRDDRGSESTLGNLVADALVAKVSASPVGAGATIGVVNPGGLRDELLLAGTGGTNVDGAVTFAEANAVLPFVNQLNAVSLTGASFKKVLEQQWQRDDKGQVPTRPYLQLGLSKNVRYTSDASRPEGSRITSVTIDGKPLDPSATYKIATFSFLATGGDNFRAFKEGTTADTGLVDYEAWIDYLRDASPVSPSFVRHGVATTGVKSVYEPGDQVSVTLPKLDLTSLGSPANTAVTATLAYGGQTKDLGSFPVTAGSSTISFTLPAAATGAVTLTATAAPTGTVATIPLDVKLVTTTKATAPATAKAGTTFTVGATVTSTTDVAPTGTVTVTEGSTVLGSAPLAAGRASVQVPTSGLDVDEHALTVSYSGDATHAASSDTATVEVVKGLSGFTATAAPGTYGQPSTVTVAGDPASSGLVYVTRGGQLVGMGFLTDGAGTVTLGGTAVPPGTSELTVFYGGDQRFDPTSTTASITVAKGSTSLRVTKISPSKVVKGRTKPFVTVAVSGRGFTVDGGTVTLSRGGQSWSGTVRDGKVRIRVGTFSSSGSAKKVTATYSGDAVASGSSTTFTVKVAKK